MAACYNPYQLRDTSNGATFVPCGKCENCYARRVSAWSFRLMQEDKRAWSSFFITLTYDTKHVPLTKNGYMALSKRDVQLFYKRLRKLHYTTGVDAPPIRYYTCGEYGGKTNRPHYHAIIFNASLELIEKAWTNGAVHYGELSAASVGYTLKYIAKPGRIPMHRNDDRIPEFALMSKGLGENYLTDAMIKWHRSAMNDRMYVNLKDGRKVSMARYYKQKIYTDEERKAVGIVSRARMLKQAKMDKTLSPHQRSEAFHASQRRLSKVSQARDGL